MCKEAIKEALRRMDESDLNQDIWGDLFKEIIKKSEGGTKEATIKIPYPLCENEPRVLMGFIQHYLKMFGMSTHLSMVGSPDDLLTYHPK